MQPQLGIWKRFVRSLLRVNRCSLSWGCGRGLLEVYWGWTDSASAGDLEEVYYKFISDGQIQPLLGMWKRFVRSFISCGQMQPHLGIWKRFIRSLLGVDRCSVSQKSGRDLLEVYQGWTDASSACDLDEIDQKFIKGGQMHPQLGMRKRFIRSLLGVDRCSLNWGCGRGLLEVY